MNTRDPGEEEYWKKKLTPQQYHILREKATEPSHSGRFNKHWENGTYVCAGCGAPLFNSLDKYDSGTGWPSFGKPVEGAVETTRDSARTEVLCIKCAGHLGHVFEDGPPERGGKRYCINSGALDFTPEQGK